MDLAVRILFAAARTFQMRNIRERSRHGLDCTHVFTCGADVVHSYGMGTRAPATPIIHGCSWVSTCTHRSPQQAISPGFEGAAFSEALLDLCALLKIPRGQGDLVAGLFRLADFLQGEMMRKVEGEQSCAQLMPSP